MTPRDTHQKDLTTLDVSRRLNVCQPTVRRMLSAGDLKGYKFGKGAQWRVKEVELQRYRDRGGVPVALHVA